MEPCKIVRILDSPDSHFGYGFKRTFLQSSSLSASESVKLVGVYCVSTSRPTRATATRWAYCGSTPRYRFWNFSERIRAYPDCLSFTPTWLLPKIPTCEQIAPSSEIAILEEKTFRNLPRSWFRHMSPGTRVVLLVPVAHLGRLGPQVKTAPKRVVNGEDGPAFP